MTRVRRYVILGGGGQLGRALAARLGPAAVALGRAEADVTQPEALRAILSRLHADVVFNCAAYNHVDRAESEPEAAFAVNAFAVRDLAAICSELQTPLVHFSTNYVFGADETRRTPYAEKDLPGPVNVYGASKLMGEKMARAGCARHFIIRTCGLYGESEGNFVAKILRLARAGKPLRVVNDQICTPTSAAELAETVAILANGDSFGLYHITNGGACSWHEFAEAAIAAAKCAATVEAISSRDYPAAAPRPAYSVLANAAYERLGLPPLRPWRSALDAFITGAPG